MAESTLALQMAQLFAEFLDSGHFKPGQLIVIGCSTSEVAGDHIGQAGSPDIAAQLFGPLERLAREHDMHLAFQCCEHLNRALVVERRTMEAFNLEEVSVVPHPHAGGSMASHAYRHFNEAVVVEAVQAHGGIDIGETLIGMHLRPVAVPLRLSSRTLGAARLNACYTRPKLIGGERAQYSLSSGSCGR